MSLHTRMLCDRCGFVSMHCQCNKITDELNKAGFKQAPRTYPLSTQQGPGDFKSYFDYLFERRLQGKENIEPITEELWNAMKMQLSYYQGQLFKAAEDYTKLQNKLRDAEEMIRDLQRENRKS